MAKRKKSNEQHAPAEAAPTFEESLEELQQIVAELEDGTLGLEESMQRFEKGISLLRHCYEVLGKAEQRIEVLTGTDAQGNPVTAPFDAPATVSSGRQSTGRKSNKKSAKTETTGDSEIADPNTDAESDEDADHTLF